MHLKLQAWQKCSIKLLRNYVGADVAQTKSAAEMLNKIAQYQIQCLCSFNYTQSKNVMKNPIATCGTEAAEATFMLQLQRKTAQL